MQGTRVKDNTEPLELKPGEYTKSTNGDWWLFLPAIGTYNSSLARINSSVWSIIEHDDNTITVSPSIRQSTTRRDNQQVELWHGFLKHGEFTL